MANYNYGSVPALPILLPLVPIRQVGSACIGN